MNEPNTTTDTPTVGESLQGLRSAANDTARAVAHEAEVAKDVALNKFQHARQVAIAKMEALRDQASAGAAVARTKATKGWNQACDKAKDLSAASEDYVKENPGKSVLIAFGVGAAIGWLLNNRR